MILITLASAISLFSRLGVIAHGLTILAAILVVAGLRRDFARFLGQLWSALRSVHPLAWLIFAVIFLFALAKTPSLAANYDTGLYHAQAIRWIEEYPAVPGLGNLFRYLAYGSSWFVASAFTGFAFLGGQSFHGMGGFLFVLFALYGTLKLSNLLHGRLSISNFAAIPCLFFIRWFFSLELSSPGTDLPAALFAWLIFLLALEVVENQAQELITWKIGAVLVLAVFSLTIKLSLIPILLIPLFLMVLARKELSGRRLSSLVLIGVVTALPWLGRNIIQSGYLVFPVYQIDWLNPDWKMPPQYVKDTADTFTAWSRIPRADKDTVLKMSYGEWVPVWLQAQTRNNRYLLYAAGGGSLLLAAGVILESLRKRGSWRRIRPFLALYLTAGVGLVFWFTQAPDFRFGYAYLGILVGMLLAPFGLRLFSMAGWIQKAGALAIVLFFGLYYAQGLVKMRSPDYLKEILLSPVSYPDVETRLEPMGNFMVSMPVVLDQCWYSELPCTSLHNPEVNLRGDNLQAGFYNKYMHR